MVDLKQISSPKFLKEMNLKELKELCEQIRKFIIENVSQTGGHLSSNLGLVEATVALHYVFDSPYDKFIFDVGHQSYTHKILTGRAKDFSTLRQTNGLSGFIKYNESPHDVFEAGHSSTSIGAMCGYLKSKELGSNIGEVISIIGDGSVGSSLSFGAMNYLADMKSKGIIILNDNGLSISKNVGRLAKLLNRVRTNKVYRGFKRLTPNFIKRVLSKFSRTIKEFAYGDNYFQAFGFKYIGSINGNDLRQLIKYFKYAKSNKTTTVIHIKTIKGLGYKPAMEDTDGFWHGVGKFNVETGEMLGITKEGYISYSEGVSNIVLEKMKVNEKIVCLTPAMIKGSKLEHIIEMYPKRVFDVGINEDLSVLMSSTLSLSGFIPVNFIYSSFIQRAYDQLNHDIARSNHHSIYLIDRCGIIPQDGDTHQGIFDVSIFTSLPNFVVLMGKDLTETYQLFDYAVEKLNCPVAIRFPKEDTIKTFEKSQIDSLDWEVIKEISKVNIISYGSNVLKIYDEIKDDNIGLINARSIKPIDTKTLTLLNNSIVYCYEEVEEIGSVGNLILLEINRLGLNIDLRLTSIKDKYISHGDVLTLKQQIGLSITDFTKKVKSGE